MHSSDLTGELDTPATLVIVPCGLRKVWQVKPDAGSIAARDAYVGSPFIVSRRYAEGVGGAWLILSAKYGFIWPSFQIPGPYDVTFKRRSTNPVTAEFLRQQVREMRLDRFHTVVGLGGKDYRSAVEDAFHGLSPSIVFPFAGLRQGLAMSAMNRALQDRAC